MSALPSVYRFAAHPKLGCEVRLCPPKASSGEAKKGRCHSRILDDRLYFHVRDMATIPRGRFAKRVRSTGAGLARRARVVSGETCREGWAALYLRVPDRKGCQKSWPWRHRRVGGSLWDHIAGAIQTPWQPQPRNRSKAAGKATTGQGIGFPFEACEDRPTAGSSVG